MRDHKVGSTIRRGVSRRTVLAAGGAALASGTISGFPFVNSVARASGAPPISETPPTTGQAKGGRRTLRDGVAGGHGDEVTRARGARPVHVDAGGGGGESGHAVLLVAALSNRCSIERLYDV